MKRLLTVGELSQILQVPKSWIYARTRTGEIPVVRVGKYVRFDVDAIERLFTQPRSLKTEKRGP